MDNRHTYQQQDVTSVWDRVAETYDPAATSGADYRAYLQIILECVGDPAGKCFCEVGCGSGTTSALLRKMDAKVTLVDISPKAIAFAQRHFENLGLEAHFCLQDGLKMGFRNDTFDVVCNGGVIEHFTDNGKVALIREMWRIVRPGGILLIGAPNATDLPFRLGRRYAEWRGTWRYGYEDDLKLGCFRKLAKRAGLQNFEFFAYNPIVGWWFLPYGKAITQRLGLNIPKWHAKRTRFGHVICLLARKPLKADVYRQA